MPVSPAKRDDAEEAEKEKEKEENEQEEKSNGSPSTTTTAARSGRVEAVINVKPVGRNHLSLSLTNPLTDNRISFLYGGGGGGSEIGSGRVHRTSSLSESTQASTANRYFASPTSPSFLHLGQLKTGVVSRVIRAISDSRFMRSRMFKHSAAPMHWCHPPTQPLRHQVRTLAKDFEDGAADHIGPLKLYHAETYKRELRKITSNKLGRVFRRIRCFEFLSTTEKLLSDQQLAQVQSKELPQLSSPPDQTPHVPKVSTAPNLAPKSGNDRRFSRKESFIAAVTKNKAQCLDINANISGEGLVEVASRNGYSIPSKTTSTNRKNSAFDSQPSVRFDSALGSIVTLHSGVSTPNIETEHVREEMSGAEASGESQRRSMASKSATKHIQPCMKSRSETAISAFPAESVDVIWFEGELKVKQISLENGMKCPDHSWKETWAVLVQNMLYLCPRRPDTLSVKSEILKSIKGIAHSVIDVLSSMVDIAYAETKHKNVFRCITRHQAEYLLQARTSEEMMGWIETLQRCSCSGNLEAISSSSLDVIVKRYEKVLQSTSPSKRPSFRGLRKTARSVSALATESLTDLYGSMELPASSAPSLLAKLERGRKSKHRKKSKDSVLVNGTVTSGSVFGRNLEHCLTTSETDYVPFIVRLCVAVVESFGINMIGVYRIPGNTAAVHSLSAKANEGFETIDFTDIRWRDVNVVSSLLKAFFRNLPEPLLTNELYFHFIEASRLENADEKLSKLTQLVHQLPKRNFETLKFLMYHLRKIVAYSHINKMEARNLALMFGPSIVRCDDEDANRMVWHMQDHCNVVETFITNCERIFGSEISDDRFVQKHSYELCGTRIENLLQVMDAAEKDVQRRAHSITPTSSTKQNNVADARNRVFSAASYVERNIDEEIARHRCCPTSESQMEAIGSTSAASSEEASASERSYPAARKPSQYSSDGDLSTARRIFLTGTSAEVSHTASIVQSLADHCRHLNVHPDFQDMLSLETREKIKQVSREKLVESTKPGIKDERTAVSSSPGVRLRQLSPSECSPSKSETSALLLTEKMPAPESTSPHHIFNRTRLRRVVPRSLLQNCGPSTVQKRTITSW